MKVKLEWVCIAMENNLGRCFLANCFDRILLSVNNFRLDANLVAHQSARRAVDFNGTDQLLGAELHIVHLAQRGLVGRIDKSRRYYAALIDATSDAFTVSTDVDFVFAARTSVGAAEVTSRSPLESDIFGIEFVGLIRQLSS